MNGHDQPREEHSPAPCRSCCWWVAWTTPPMDGKARLGECRFNAPTLVTRPEVRAQSATITRWASTKETDFCQAHRQRVES